MRTEYEFVLPKGYVDESGTLHKRGTMRLATARDELQPLRDPTVSGPDDPRLTLLVLVRVIETLGTLPMVTMHEMEGLFAADLAYLQDFYGVINFGSEDDVAALLAAQADADTPTVTSSAPEPASRPAEDVGTAPAERPTGRRAAIEEVPSSGR
jgi:hypothetical protein